MITALLMTAIVMLSTSVHWSGIAAINGCKLLTDPTIMNGST